jgi:aspartate kinase
MQVSALTFSACFDYDEQRFTILQEALQINFSVKYNQHLQLVTIRHYDESTLKSLTVNKKILLEQLSRNTAQLVLKENDYYE